MDASNLWRQAQAWLAPTRRWFSERARRRRDAEDISRMDAHELRDLGLSHAGAIEGRILMTECGPVLHGNWMHAKPCFPRRAIAPGKPRAPFQARHGHAD